MLEQKMEAARNTTGLLAATFTPMDGAGAVRLDPIDRMARAFADAGLTGVFVCGSSGEGISLTIDERRAVAERWVEAGRETGLHVIVHVGCLCLADAAALAAHAESIGADGVSAVPPSYFRPETIDGLIDAGARVAEAAPETPFYAYYIPSRTGITLPMDEYLEKAPDRIPNLAGLKYTDPDLMGYLLCVNACGGRYIVRYGADQMALPALAVGATSFIGSTYNLMAPVYRRVIEAFEAGDLAAARAAQDKANRSTRALLRSGGLTACKEALNFLGFEVGPPRAPLEPLSKDASERLRAELDKVGFFEEAVRVD